MDRATVSAAVQAALQRLINEQPELLDLDVTERALSHHLACYLAQVMPVDYQVDVEYNRHGRIPKRLQLLPRTAKDNELRAITVFPDILVHERGTDDKNLLVLEVKKPGESLDYDQQKLVAFRNELGYQHTAHVVVGRCSDGSTVQDVIWVDE